MNFSGRRRYFVTFFQFDAKMALERGSPGFHKTTAGWETVKPSSNSDEICQAQSIEVAG